MRATKSTPAQSRWTGPYDPKLVPSRDSPSLNIRVSSESRGFNAEYVSLGVEPQKERCIPPGPLRRLVVDLTTKLFRSASGVREIGDWIVEANRTCLLAQRRVGHDAVLRQVLGN